MQASAHGLALYALPSVPLLEILDVSNPLKPALRCTLGPAQGGRFDQSPTQLMFWVGNKLGSADLTSGRVVQTAQLPAVAWGGSFSRDGSEFAYRTGDDTNAGLTTHLFSGGRDHILYTQEPLGGHGVGEPSTFSRLEFSPDSDRTPKTDPPSVRVPRF